MTPKHTPGPWKAHLNVPTAQIPGHIITADNEASTPVASVWVGWGTQGSTRQIANAHLIAAAPQLLEALTNLENDAGQMPDSAWTLIQDAIESAGGKRKDRI